MTLRDFISQLQALPPAALDAIVCVEYVVDETFGVEPEIAQELVCETRYGNGWVTLFAESADPD